MDPQAQWPPPPPPPGARPAAPDQAAWTPPPSPPPGARPAGLPGDETPPNQGPIAPPPRPLLKRLFGPLAALGVLLVKFGAKLKFLLLLLPKLKLLTTFGSALVSVAAYALFFGFPFAVGFVVLLFVHEMGHVFQLRREGIKASAPLFIPFMGAVVGMKSLPEDALAEARVGLAGPVLGTIGAAACIPLAAAGSHDFFLALAYVGFFLNLINLVPVVPLDGGRAMAAMSPWMWLVGFFAVLLLAFTRPSPILLIIVIFAGIELYRRLKLYRSGGQAQAAYYKVSPRNRLLVGAVYLGLIAVLALGMYETYVTRTIG